MPATVSEKNAVWNLIQNRIEGNESISSEVYDAFFSQCKLISIESNVVTIGTDSKVAASVLATSYKKTVEGIIREILQGEYVVNFIFEQDVEVSKKGPEKATFFAKNHLKEEFSFKTFVVGDCNREAYQAALMAAETPGGLYNPLFIYGGSGLGKTHLLYAIGNSYQAKHPGAKVLYTTADDFFDEYVRFCTGEKRGDELRDFFRNDVNFLLVDDVQQLKGRRQTEETFFTIFNALISAGKQIVITSDTHPEQLEGFDSRLKTRFTQGLTLSINPPDENTAYEILKNKIAAYGNDLSIFDEDALRFIAGKFSSNVRELEGRLTRLLFYLSLHKTDRVTLEVAKDAVQNDLEVKEDKAKLSEEKILNKVADYFRLSPAQISGKIRTGQIALARHVTMYLIRDLLDLPFAKIGEFLGGKDHATVMSGVQKVEKNLKTNPSLKKTIQVLKSQLKS